MKEGIKKYLPKSWIKALGDYKLKRSLLQITKHDSERFIANSCLLDEDGEAKLQSRIALRYHIIEKGLTMPHMRLGFGQENIRILIALCERYANLYDCSHETLLHGVSVLQEYLNVHKESSFDIDDDIVDGIEQLSQKVKVAPSSQAVTDRAMYFRDAKAAFEQFAWSRHSVRNFATEEGVAIEDIKKAIALAQSAPSACNKQPSRVHIIANRRLIDEILSIQKGNRGFGSGADKLLLLTVDLSCYAGIRERNLCYIDSGIYAMNLLYALHYHEIAACPLNWCDTIEDDTKIRQLVPLLPSETITLVVLCGKPAETTFKLTLSPRLAAESRIIIHE